MLLINENNKEKLPFKYFSPSSILEFLTNEKSFFKRYIKYEWDEKTSPALLVGTAYHSALEELYKAEIEGIEITDSQIIDHGLNAISRLFTYFEKKGIEKLAEDKNKNFEKLLDAILTYERIKEEPKEIGEFIEKLEKQLEILQEDPEKFNDEIIILTNQIEEYKKGKIKIEDVKRRAEHNLQGITEEEIEEYKRYYIDFGITGSKDKAKKDLIIAINNYLENKDKLPKFTPIQTETNEIGEFVDFDGKKMPIGIKGKMDLLARDKNGNLIIIDHKCVSAFGEKNGSYEIQASAYYFVAQALTGEQPKKMIFNETIKKVLNPAKGLKKADLIKLCKENNLDTTGLVEDLQVRLVDAGVLEVPNPINQVVIEFEEEPEIIQTFIEIYKQILNRSYYYFIEKTLKFLPNPKADFTGAESWEEYKKEVVYDIDPIEDLEPKQDEEIELNL